MQANQVVELFRELTAAGARVWLAGGWAVDAIVGHQTRDHGDVDAAVDVRDMPVVLGVLDRLGFAVSTNWAPARLGLTASDGRVVDLHPVTFTEDGSGRQSAHGGGSFEYAADGFAVGSIDGSPIPCLSVDQQLRFRTGYEPRPQDIHDVQLLQQCRWSSRTGRR